MEIKLCNIGHIDEACIEVDSITVIAGNNNTGKSTVGKVLYATATGLNLLEAKRVLIEKGEVIAEKIEMFSRLIELDEEEVLLEQIRDYCFYSEFLEEFHEDSFSEIDRKFSRKVDSKLNFIVSLIMEKANDNQKNAIKMLHEDLKTFLIKSINDNSYKINIMQKVFDEVFQKQMTTLLDSNLKSSISIKEINQEYINLSFSKQQLEHANTSLDLERPFAKALYIDNPFVLDTIRSRHVVRRSYYSPSDTLIRALLNNKNTFERNLFELDSREKHIEEIFKYIMKEGRITLNEGLKYIMNDNVNVPLSITNLSTGLKSFSIMDLLLRSDALRKLEYLILDEPEIHLHPEWQLKYAELVVLMSKQFNIKVIVNSHSPYFIEAIELYSKKHLYSSNLKFYKTIKSKGISSMYTIQDVTNNLKSLYTDLAMAFYDLEELRTELKFMQ